VFGLYRSLYLEGVHPNSLGGRNIKLAIVQEQRLGTFATERSQNVLECFLIGLDLAGQVRAK
jgi:hypothetical protein